MSAVNDATPRRATREETRVVIGALRKHRDQGHPISNAAVNAAAARLGFHKRYIRELIKNGVPEKDGPFVPDEEHIDAYHAAHGDAVEALAICKERGVEVPVEKRQFQRAFARHLDPAVKGGAKEGWSGVVSRQGYLPKHIPHKFHTVGIDHTPPPVLLRPDNEGGEPYLAWETTAIDEATRFELVLHVQDGAPDTITTVGVLTAVVEGYEHEGVFIGGKPLHVLSDNGSDLQTQPATSGLVTMGVKRQFSGVGQPWQNGRVERHHLLVQRKWCSGLPGYINPDASRKDQDKIRDYYRKHPELLLTIEQYQALRYRRQMQHNYETPQAVLGGLTPFAALAADPYQPERAEPEALRLALLAREKRVVDHGRIRIFSDSYYSDNGALGDLGGVTVEVRYLPGRRQYIEVFHNGEHVCRAYPKDNLPGAAVAATAENRAKKRSLFLAYAAQGEKIRAERARKQLDEFDFDDEGLPAIPPDGASPWQDTEPQADTEAAPTAKRGRQAPACPTPTPEGIAELDEIIRATRETHEEFA